MTLAFQISEAEKDVPSPSRLPPENMAAKAFTNQFDFDVIITTTEMHTGGESVRIIESGFPVPQGKTILEKIEDLRQNHDVYRKLVIYEPRGHFDLYSVLLVTPDHPDADIGAIFMHNEGYAPMCGHVCISLGRYAVDKGLVRRPITSPETQVNIQVPCGMVKAFVKVDSSPGRKSGRVRFESVPCFVVGTDVEVNVNGIGSIPVDISYGGAFYAFVDVSDVGLDFEKTSSSQFSRIGQDIKEACSAVVTLSHPEVPAYLYGVIFVDSRSRRCDGASIQLCIFAKAETDRSPCGSGTGARIALMYHRNLLGLRQKQTFRNPLSGSQFIGTPVRESMVGDKKALVTEVEGQGYYCGKSTFYLEKEDIIGRGFLVQ